MDVTESRGLLLHMEWADSLALEAALGVPALARDKRLLTRFRRAERRADPWLSSCC
jgi:hypothetical protein